MAVTKNPKGLRVRSHAFGLWKDKEKREGRDISLDAICRETGLAKLTARRFLVPKEEDVNGSRLDAAAVLAYYFGVGLDALVTIEAGESEEESDHQDTVK